MIRIVMVILAIIFIVVTIILAVGLYYSWNDVQQATQERDEAVQEVRKASLEVKQVYDECITEGFKEMCDSMIQ